MNSTQTQKNANKKERAFLNRKTKRLIFYVLLLAFPVIQFCIMAIYVRLDSMAMAFQIYKPGTDGYIVEFSLFGNFKDAFTHVVQNNSHMIKNSLLVFLCCAIPGITLAVISSYYIYKNFILSKAFMFILFLPKVIAPIVFSIVFKYMATDLYMAMMKAFGVTVKGGLLSGMATRLPTLITYTLFMSMCANILLYVGGMTSINDSVIEYSKIDGVGFWQEFIYIVLPSVYPTIVTFLTVSISQIFSQQMHLFDFYGDTAVNGIQTLGYHFYVSLLQSDLVSPKEQLLSYPSLTALGILIMIVMIPITLITKKLMLKFGPSDE